MGGGWRCPTRFLGYVYIEKCSYKHEDIAPPHLDSKTFSLRGGGGAEFTKLRPPSFLNSLPSSAAVKIINTRDPTKRIISRG